MSLHRVLYFRNERLSGHLLKSIFFLLLLTFFVVHTGLSQNENKKVRMIMIGAHPDDCDQDAGATAILLASMGHALKFLSLTNGDAGHQIFKGTALAKRDSGKTGSRQTFGVA